MASSGKVLSETARRWRVALVCLCVFTIVLGVYEFVVCATSLVKLGVDATSSAGAPFLWHVEVRPGSALARAGVRSGDVIDARAMDPGDRVQFGGGVDYVRQGDRRTIAIVRGSKTDVIAVAATSADLLPLKADVISSYIGEFLFGVFALMIAWRHPDRPEARIVVLILIGFDLATDLVGGYNLLLSWQSAEVLACCAAIVTGGFWVALVATYAGLFARPLSRLRVVLTYLTYASAALLAAVNIAAVVGLWTGLIDPFVPLFGFWPFAGMTIFTNAAAIAAAFAGWSASSGVERSRMTWMLISLGTLCLLNMVGLVQALIPAEHEVNNVLAFAAAFVFAYVMLSRKLGDIGFVVNRAVVFSLVSVVLVGAFVLIEWLLADWLRDASHTTNTLVTAVVVVALGTSLRFVHGRVDRIVDVVFFRKRHEDEHAIRTFGEEAAYVSDRTVLLERAHAALTRHTDATSVAILVRGDDGRCGPADENDPAVLRLSVTHRPLDLHGFETAFVGEMAYPMVARGRLLGVIVLGERRSGELVPPDESAAIAHLAHGVAHALETLDQRRERDGLIEHIDAGFARLEAAVKRPT